VKSRILATAAAVILLALGLGAQDSGSPPAAVERETYPFRGKPIKLPGNCTGEMISALGLACTTESPCDLFLDLIGADSSGLRIFVSGNLHTDNQTVASILLASDDNGASWYEAFDRIPGAGLEQIQFLDLQTGWIGGEILDSLPRDAFFLLTGDGGKTWQRKPVFEDTHIGSIDEFWFESKDNGWLVLDRGRTDAAGNRWERLETHSGGAAWVTRDSLARRPASLRPKTIAAAPKWRLRTDIATRSWVLMRRARADTWEKVASFSVAAGPCQPEPQPQSQP
jgi:hypothetical protein